MGFFPNIAHYPDDNNSDHHFQNPAGWSVFPFQENELLLVNQDVHFQDPGLFEDSLYMQWPGHRKPLANPFQTKRIFRAAKHIELR